MISSYDVESLDKFLKNFYTAVGIRISVFDDEFRLVTEYPKQPPKFCALIRSVEAGRAGCRNCDISAFQQAKKKQSTLIYTCHAGLTEAVTPIRLGGGVLGYVILAHMMPKENYDAALENAAALCQKYGLTGEEVMPLLRKIKARSITQIEACAQLLDAIASYLYVSDWVIWRNQDMTARINEFIQNNLDQRIDSDLLCRQFFISRTRLYQLSMSAFGMSISRYVLSKRIGKAKQMLRENYTVKQVAEATGFGSANYFSKVFKKETGRTPSEYRDNMGR